MRHVICCWCKDSADGFEHHVPLRFTGRRNRALGFRGEIDVLFLDGYNLLDASYREDLEASGYRLHNPGDVYRELSDRYSSLGRFGDYEKKCFLRWPLISACFPGERIIHYDGDVVLNESPEVLSGLLEGTTFVLQGCPALTSISDPEWFLQYKHELDRFTDDITGYSERAWKERVGWEISEREKWAGQRSREIISSDQDLLSHLIHTDRIVQDRPSMLLQMLQNYVLFENPLFLHGYENHLHNAHYKRSAGTDFINDKRVMIWHMQSDFTFYLGRFLFRRKYLRLGLERLNYGLETKDFDRRLFEFFLRRIRSNIGSRLNVYRYFFVERDFSEVFTDRTWWQEGAFV